MKSGRHAFSGVARSLCATLPSMNKETLLAELDRLLDLGEPLLTMFPKQRPNHWDIQLPDNISYEMEWYAGDVALRAWNRKRYQGYRQHYTTDFLAGLEKKLEAGLLGWRAIGVLK